MKMKIFKVMFCILLIGCKSQYQITYRKQMKESYLYAFKMNYFKRLLLDGFNKSDAIKNVLAADHSGYGEPILSIEDIELTDSLVNIDNKIMVLDSLNRIGRVSEGSQGKHIFDYALGKYQSKWLDSLARERYKIYKRKERE